MQTILEARLNTLHTTSYDRPLYLTVDDQGGLLLNFRKGLPISRATTDTLFEKLLPTIKASVHTNIMQAVDKYTEIASTDRVIQDAVKQAFTKCATKLMEAALSVDSQQVSEGEQTCTKS